MPDQAFQESISNLARLSAKGAFDRTAAALDRDLPVLRELNLDAGQIRTALNTAPDQLESAGLMVPTALEAIVKIAGRPPLMVQNGKVVGATTLAGPGSDFPADIDLKIAAVEPRIASVGRIEFANHDQSWGGTGWVIGTDGPDGLLIVTNRHVAKLVARRSWTGAGVFLYNPFNHARYGAFIDFGEEEGVAANPALLCPVERFTYLAEDMAADVALARIALPAGNGAPQLEPIPLAPAPGAADEWVATVGYPAADPYRNNVTYMERYFQGLYDVKRFSPGKLMIAPGLSVLSHDCTTLGGNSGSPLISLEQKAAVGLHFAGKYGEGNSAVSAATLRALLDEIAGGQVPGTALPDAPPAEDEAGQRHDAAFFAGRRGYDPDFLAVAPVPLPGVPALLDLARPEDATDDRPHELRYQHFSVLQSRARRLPVVAALNIDGEKTRAIKRANSYWWKDARIPYALQLGNTDYTGSGFDRGHMVRRAATNWGATDEEAMRANLDSFHYTNAAPQLPGMNREPEMWLGLEDYILESTRTFGFRACVLSGPVLSEIDEEIPELGAALPMAFWKVVAMLAEDRDEVIRLHCTAYLLSQEKLLRGYLQDRGRSEAVEGFAFAGYRTFQLRLRDLAQITGLDFGPLVAADALEKTEEAPDRPLIPLAGLESILL
ncbi:DNA/RNA non-specific endonuclease [Pseudooceanicola nanhaiensis]|uniref:DNA/RNA non-specific endonuclease n=1 Tax=Pseudooceanicola nanhaiensis TaxID=375761 RepID=UPI001CD339AF|nr:DNA/RNA non-specific endonuclease [Pseudooceanicola nanhaiensis]MCA0919033.1 DNA/RNA non-specific endonuclease [Pseudooceanicola nanhaiensis]